MKAHLIAAVTGFGFGMFGYPRAAGDFPTGGTDTELQGTQPYRPESTDGVLIAPGGVVCGGRYELRGLLGRGGMAEVRDGWDLKLRRPVAIKLLYPGVGTWPESRLRFESEARAAAQLTGRHVVVIHDVGEHDGLPFIVMERLPGVSLVNHIARGPLPAPFVQGVLDSVLDALVEAHNAGIVHRDVKPGNILFTATGEPKLADFGIAKTAGTAFTRTGVVVGSMPYMSPERLASKPATAADDLYALGVVGYEALTGRRPFPQEDMGALVRAILHDSPPPLAALRPDVPPGFATTIERAMTRDPAQRFDQANAMRAALARTWRATIPARPPTRRMEAPLPAAPTFAPPGAWGEPASPRRKLWVTTIIALFILAIMLFALESPFSSPPPTPVDTTTTPASPSSAAFTTTPSSTELPPPPPGPRGKKHKGGWGGDAGGGD
jgi:serine/threonine protein kinase